MGAEDETLVERQIQRLKNNPVIAAVILLAIAISTTGAFWNNLPRSWRDWIIDHVPGYHSPAPPSYPNGGWVFAGYVDKSDEMRWSSEQRVTLMRPSGGADRPHIFRTGDVVRPLKPIPQVIADFRTQGTTNQLVPPWKVVEEIRKTEDFTGKIYTPDTTLEVMDVTVSNLPDHDYAVWLRVTPVQNSQ